MIAINRLGFLKMPLLAIKEALYSSGGIFSKEAYIYLCERESMNEQLVWH